MKENKISIDLTEKEAELFKFFRQYQDLWEEIAKVKGGKVVIHFDAKGKIRQANSEHIFYKA